MDIQEILKIFIPGNVFEVNEDSSEGLGNITHSESEDCSSEENAGDTDGETDNEGYACNFDPKNAIECVGDIERINFKDTSSEEIMSYHFPNREVAFMFYNLYACSHGFSGRKSHVVRNVKGEVVQQTFLCHREVNRSERNRNSVIRKREHKPNSRYGCLAKIQVHIDFDSGRWYIIFFDDVHNHSFLDDKYERVLPAHRKMSDYDKYQMKTMRKSCIPTSQIYGFFATQAGGYENLGYSRRDMYNEQFKHRGQLAKTI